MKLCVPFKYWQAATHCMANQDVRYYLNGIHLNGNRIESTNGHVAYFAEFEVNELDDFKVMNGQCGYLPKEEQNESWPDIIIGQFGAKASASIQKKTIWLIIEGEESDLMIKYIDRNFNVIHVQTASKIDTRYPDINKIIPKGKKNREQFNIGFNPNYLALPQKILASEKSEWSGTVKMNAWDTNTAATFEFERVARECKREVLIVMPMRQ